MSLQLRLTLAIAALLGALALAALLGLDALTRDMRTALGDTARAVGTRVFTVVREEQAALGAKLRAVETLALQRRDPAAPVANGDERIEVVVDGRRLNAEEIAALPESHPARRALRAPPVAADAVDARIAPGEGGEPMLWLHTAEGSAIPIPVPASRADAAVEEFRQRLLWGLGALLLAGLLAAAWLARRIAAPLRRLAEASERLGHGALEQRVAPSGPPEVRRSLEAFNRMAEDLVRLQAETEALRADRELAELGEIGRGLAHSLRNPLHTLGLGLDALAEGRDRGQALAASGREQLSRIDQALRGFLALSASAGARAEEVELDEVIDDVVLEASQRAAGRLAIDRGRCGLCLPAVAAELRIVLHALLINALEASPDGARITLQACSEGDGVRIEIADRGAGVPQAVRERLFQPHVSSKPSGAGMGLYLAERLVRLRYRGSLALSDREGGGTLATLRLRPREAQAGRT